MTERVVVLAGGPDAEREVSLASGRSIAEALAEGGRFGAEVVEVGEPTAEELASMAGDVLFPALHGPYGEGGRLQRALERDGRPYVASGVEASRRAIDKVLTKTLAREAGLTVSVSAVFDREDPGCPLPLPVVVKPVFEGSTIGLHVCRTEAAWRKAHAATAASGRAAMVEPFITGREITLGLVDEGSGLAPLPWIEIRPAEGLYDYRAKYERGDTVYVVDPGLPAGVAERAEAGTRELARSLGVRDLCRADFLLDEEDRAWFLEVNTMPGFTSHSLVPMAARARGLAMPALCEALVERALGRREGAASGGSEADGRQGEAAG